MNLNLETLDIAWLLLCAALVFLMQAGFTCLEAGMTRQKNNINVAVKNLTDFGISVVLFWTFGFAIIFGTSLSGWAGSTGWLPDFAKSSSGTGAFFLFQTMFCATAATIFSGSVAERMRYPGYILLTIIVSGILYPFFGHWAWNETIGSPQGGWLKELGFVDFAGSTVVHCTGGWYALAVLLVIGPRRGRFIYNRQPQPFVGSNLSISVVGIFLLWVGWIGFNGGSAYHFDDRVPQIAINTILAGASGALSALAVGWVLLQRPEVFLLMNGALAGLVSITAACNAVTPALSLFIGSVGGMTMLFGQLLLEKLQIDDAVGAIPVHLGAGIWGTLALGAFGNLDLIGTGLDRPSQLMAQFFGTVVCALWSFFIPYVLLRNINKIFPLRVTPQQEHIGLNISEHGAKSQTLDLLATMATQARTGNLTLRAPVEQFTEHGQIAEHYNKLMDTLQKAVDRTESILRDIRDAIITFTKDGLVINFNPAAESVFGYSTQEAIGAPATMLLGCVATTNKKEILSKLVEMGSTVSTQSKNDYFFGIRKDKSTFPVELSVSEGRSGEDVLWTSLVRDATVTREMERQSQNYLDDLERERENLRITEVALQGRVREQREAREATLNLLQDHYEMRITAEKAEEKFRSLSVASPVGVFETDPEGYLTYTNPRWDTIVGQKQTELGKINWIECVNPKRKKILHQAWEKTITKGCEFEQEFIINGIDGVTRWVYAKSTAVKADDGAVTSFVGTLEDITLRKDAEQQLKSALKEKEVLLQEIHHRVKNNLQVISSLLNLQSGAIDDPKILRIFKESQNRVKSMSLIHEKLYRSEDLTRIGFVEYIETLSVYLFRSYKINANDIQFRIKIKKNLFLNVDSAVPCGLIINELVSNSLKHAFPGGRTGKIIVGLEKNNKSELNLLIKDDGVGIPETIDIMNTESLGMQIVSALVSQLDGSLNIERENGTAIYIRFRNIPE